MPDAALVRDEVYVGELHAAHAAMLRALPAADHDAPVPTCPDWTVRDLVEHLAAVHLWSARAVRDGDAPGSERPVRPLDIDLTTWSARGGSELLLALADCPADRTLWTFAGPATGTVSFWKRRQAHETALHGVDLAVALGAAPVYPPRLADDAVDEVFDSMLPGQHRRRPIDLRAPVTLHATDSGTSWTLRPGDPPTSSHDAVPGATLATAPAGDLALGLWGRVDWRESWRVGGDTDVVEHLMAQRIVP